MSLFRYSDYGGKKERPKKTKLPTQAKSERASTCPFCSKKAWSKKLRRCKNCGKSHTPEKELMYKKFKLK